MDVSGCDNKFPAKHGSSVKPAGKTPPSFNDPEKQWTDFLFEKCLECAAQDP